MHPECEQQAKKLADNVIAVVQRASLLGRDDPRQKQDFDTVRKLVERVKTEAGETLGGLRRKPLTDGVRLWVQGLHAALYGEYWKPAVHWIESPMPSFNARSAKTLREQMETTGEMSRTARYAVGAAYFADNWDGLVCWGGRVTYYCTWHRVAHEVDHRWMCLWGLNLPGLMEWSASVRSEPVPWHGCYGAKEIPESASRLTQRDIDRYNEMLAS